MLKTQSTQRYNILILIAETPIKIKLKPSWQYNSILDKLDINKISNNVIGAAIEVHKTLGPGLLESTYEECLCYELDSRKISFDRQLKLPIKYKNKKLSCGYRLDILVENSIILELKAVDKIETIHRAQLLTYLKLSNKSLGLILNFNVILMRDGIVRVVNNFKDNSRIME